jgi:hypothetical protein
MFKNLFSRNALINILFNFFILKLIIEIDGNISLRYFSDEIYTIYQFEVFYITMDYIILFIVLFTYVTKFIVEDLNLIINNKYSAYILYFFIYSSCLLITLLFFRIYDLERLYLLAYILFMPFFDSLILNNLSSKLEIKVIFTLFVMTITLFSYTSENTLLSVDGNPKETDIENNFLTFETTIESEFDLSPAYRLTRTRICCDEYAFYNTGGKSLGYLDISGNHLFHITGTGVLLNYEVDKLVSNESQIPKLIETNITDIIKNPFLKNLENWESIKDILIHDNEVYISFIEEQSNDCTNVQIITGKFDLETIQFEKFFEYEECAQRSVSPYNAHQSGGKLLMLNNDTLALTTGDYRKYTKPQDFNSLFGKILSIDLDTRENKIISLGHRNPQGLSATKNSDFLISTEHGPKGGDEINIIDLTKQENFGWPLASYGNHYDGLSRPEAPLKKNHDGFKEPAWFFSSHQNDSHGISSVEINYFSNQDSFFVGSMKAGLLYEIEVDFLNNELTNIKTYKVGDRIRDFIYDKKTDSYIFLLEERPAFGVLKEKSTPNLDIPYINLNN